MCRAAAHRGPGAHSGEVGGGCSPGDGEVQRPCFVGNDAAAAHSLSGWWEVAAAQTSGSSVSWVGTSEDPGVLSHENCRCPWQ